jgi:multiple sugar transport system substrate-binding protein
VLRGINWGHRRAVGPLAGTTAAFREEHPDIEIAWSQRSLSGFEFDPVPDLAEKFDLIVLDHPFCGDIAATGSLLPLDGLSGLEEEAFVGPSLVSYRYEGRIWALPIDAACQVAVSRPDLLAILDAPAPSTWDEALALGRRARRLGLSLAIAFKGVHGLMTFFTLCANFGRPCGADPAEPLFAAEVAAAALDAMDELLACCPAETLDWDSIALHEMMIADDRLVFCPAVYCYATYAEADLARPLGFHPLAGLRGSAGSTLGGTGLGISRHCGNAEAALAYAAYLLRPETQIAFADHHGQPARLEAWTSSAADARFGGTFSATRATMEATWIRPRYPGYPRFQSRAGDQVELYLRRELPRRDLLQNLSDLHAQGRASWPKQTAAGAGG